MRQALYQATDSDRLMRVTMRGLGQATGATIAPQVHGWDESIHKRLPYSQDAARKLLAKPATRRASRWTSPAPGRNLG